MNKSDVILLIKENKEKFRKIVEKIYNINGKNYHTDTVEELYKEISLNGGNTFSNFKRGGDGVPYEEIFMDVAKKLKINKDTYKQTEQAINNELAERFEKSILPSQDYVIQQMIDESKEKVTSTAVKSMGLGVLTPLGGALYAIKKASDPATRKTIPTVIYITLLNYLAKED